MIREVVFGIVLSGLALSAHSYTIGSKTISKVNVNLTSGIYFRTVEDMVDPHDCRPEGASVGWYHLMSSGDYEKEAYSLLLAAKISKTKVTFAIDQCDGGYPRVTYIHTE